MTEPTKPPIFVVGCPRSGTSVTGWAIAQHPGFVSGPESHFLYYLCAPQRDLRSEVGNHIVDSYKRSLTGDSWLDTRKVGFPEFAAAIGKGIAELFASYSQGRVWVDSSPEHAMVMDALVALFPETKIVHIVRDARDVCKSMLHSGFPAPWATDLERACETWNNYVRKGVAAEKRLGQSVIRVRQEDLRTRPDSTTQRIFDFLGVERPPAVLEFLEHGEVNSSYNRNSQLATTGKRVAPAETPAGAESKVGSIWKPGMEKQIEHACRDMLTLLGYLDAPPRQS